MKGSKILMFIPPDSYKKTVYVRIVTVYVRIVV